MGPSSLSTMGGRYEIVILKILLEFSEILAGSRCLSVTATITLTLGSQGGSWLQRLTEPASSARIASKLPRLTHAYLFLKDECKRDEELRKNLRDGKLYDPKNAPDEIYPNTSLDFARNLHLFPPNIQEFQCEFDYAPPSDQCFSPFSVTKGVGYMFSSHLRDFSQQLTILNIRGAVLGEDLFRL
jgi:hypothetical protein